MDAAVAIQATLFEEILDLFVIENVGKSLPDGKSVRYACLHEIPRLTGPGVEQPTDVALDELAKVHSRNHAVGIQQDINRLSAQVERHSIRLWQSRHPICRQNRPDHALIAVTAHDLS